MTAEVADHPTPGAGADPAATRTIRLPARLNYAAADELSEAFEHLRDSPVVVDATDVTHLGAICLQVLLSAQKQWQLDEVPFRVEAASVPFTDALRLLGVGPDTLQPGVR